MSSFSPPDYRVQASSRFAALNGWRPGRRAFGPFSHVIDPGRAEFYVAANDKPIGIIVHLPTPTDPLREQISKRDDLVLHIPPAGRLASWLFPGSSLTICITRPQTEVVWPDDAAVIETIIAHARHNEETD